MRKAQSLHVTLVCYGEFLIYLLSLASLSVRSSVMALNASISMSLSEALPTVTLRMLSFSHLMRSINQIMQRTGNPRRQEKAIREPL